MTAEEQEVIAPGKIKITIRFPGGGSEGASRHTRARRRRVLTLQRGIDMSIMCKPTTPFSKVYGAVAAQRGVTADSFKLYVLSILPGRFAALTPHSQHVGRGATDTARE